MSERWMRYLVIFSTWLYLEVIIEYTKFPTIVPLTSKRGQLQIGLFGRSAIRFGRSAIWSFGQVRVPIWMWTFWKWVTKFFASITLNLSITILYLMFLASTPKTFLSLKTLFGKMLLWSPPVANWGLPPVWNRKHSTTKSLDTPCNNPFFLITQNISESRQTQLRSHQRGHDLDLPLVLKSPESQPM